MSKDNSIGSLFGKARKWAQQELKNAVSVDESAERDDTVAEALTPESIKGFQAMTTSNRADQQASSKADARIARQARAGTSSVELTGYVTGRADGLAVESTPAEDSRDVYVSVECVDPVAMAGGTVSGFCFKVPDFHGDGTYELLDHPDFDSLQYELYLLDANSEGWGFHPSFGPGVITVAQGIADVRLVLGGASDDTIHLHATIVLPDH